MGPKNCRNYIHNTERNQTTCSRTGRLQFAVPIPGAWSLHKFVPIDDSELKIYGHHQIKMIWVPKLSVISLTDAAVETSQ
jgi:hypothetical protein